MSLDGYDTLFGLIDRGELIGAPAKTPRRGRHMCRLFSSGDSELDKMIVCPVIHKDHTVTFAHWNEEKFWWEVLRKQEFIYRSDWEALPAGERERLERGGIQVEP